MSLLERHLEQISLSSESIATLPFPPPKIFTNALLSTQDITSLIRDTEPHERALFSVPPPAAPPTSQTPYPDPKASGNRRQTVFNVASGEVTTGNGVGARAPRRNTAVAAVLGPELHSEVRKTEAKGEVDIEVLLRGAETLNDVYSISGVPEQIRALRTRYGQIQASVKHYEQKVARQTRELERMNRGDDWDADEDEEDGVGRETPGSEVELDVEVTDEDLRREEEEIRELDRKKKELEDRVSGMERDLGGLLR
ncbi:Outer kinetochore SPC34 [Hyphodiscus hymeniophilus]|uniref:DASH complex subunit SPC34 n=1 Tax=Hyphodiscus hymeniophilus TaxID=353542 RepID=A0A9P6VFQ5_9HELO|nr:Outer kinetochore SPC34 [Hyphodiscus hymeniophilus]